MHERGIWVGVALTQFFKARLNVERGSKALGLMNLREKHFLACSGFPTRFDGKFPGKAGKPALYTGVED